MPKQGKAPGKQAAVPNIALFDSTKEEAADFIRGLEDATGEPWEAVVYKSNGARRSVLDTLNRYLKYFLLPMKVFVHRKEYRQIIGWQEFYGLIYAFYCRLFHVKKQNFLVIKNFIYKPKQGIWRHIYYRFMKYMASSRYIDVFISDSQANCDYCCRALGLDRKKFQFIPFGVQDFSRLYRFPDPPTQEAVLSLGRSNRDWEIVLNSFNGFDYKIDIVCDQLKGVTPPSDNIRILTSVWDEASYEYIYNCKCMLICTKERDISGGNTVLIKAMQFGRPIIITKPSILADDYVIDGYNGLAVEKTPEAIRAAVQRLYDDPELCARLGRNARQLYEQKYSLHQYGMNVGNTILEYRGKEEREAGA